MDDIERQIRQRVRDRREYLQRTGRRNLTQAKVAELMDMARTTYANKETGEYSFSVGELSQLAKILSVPISYFFGEGEYHPDDVPEELRSVNGFYGKVIHALPPGKARDKYIKSLYERAEADWELVTARLEAEAEGAA